MRVWFEEYFAIFNGISNEVVNYNIFIQYEGHVEQHWNVFHQRSSYWWALLAKNETNMCHTTNFYRESRPQFCSTSKAIIELESVVNIFFACNSWFKTRCEVFLRVLFVLTLYVLKSIKEINNWSWRYRLKPLPSKVASFVLQLRTINIFFYSQT